MSFSLALLICLGAAGADPASFVSAQPVWAEGRETEMNLNLGFRAIFDAPASGKTTLRVTGSMFYRAFVNGEYAGYGPVRAAHGFFRVDEWDITPKLRPGKNVVALEVVACNVGSYFVIDQPGFVQAEVAAGDQVLASTRGKGAPFEARVMSERVQKVQRYSFQRAFMEVYKLDSGRDGWRSDPEAKIDPVPLVVTAPKKLLGRGVPYPEFPMLAAKTLYATGAVKDKEPKEYRSDRSLEEIKPDWKCWPKDQLDAIYTFEAQRLATVKNNPVNKPLEAGAATTIAANSFATFDFGANRSGFLRMQVACEKPVRLFAFFDEALTRNDVDWLRLGCNNVIIWQLEPGSYTLESFEPNTMRYMKLAAMDGDCTASGVALRQYENPDTKRAAFTASDERLNELFTAAVSTFAQNAPDVFMDCPHRERAGWLCDSFFTARTASVISGNTRVERNFLENFLLPDSFAALPKGMLPMCYPADHPNGIFIPNWAMWFVVELEEYLARSNDRALVDALQPRVMALLDYFKPFENSDGLLEKLASWVFVEWSKANDYVQDVNYPSNMLYAGMLDATARMYNKPEIAEKAAAIRKTIRAQALKSEFFSDNALRKDGKLEVTDNTTEVCQYFAFYFGVATKEQDPKLWKILADEFGPDRVKQHGWPKVAPANSFIGNMLRMELLSQDGRSAQIMKESIGYLKYMADRTGTLWENVQDNASLNHGFASHAAFTFYRDILGVRRIDSVAKKIEVVLPDVPMEWCQGDIPVGDQTLHLEWKRQGNKIIYSYRGVDGFAVSVTAAPGLTAKELV